MQNSKAIEETNQFKYITIKHLDKGKKNLVKRQMTILENNISNKSQGTNFPTTRKGIQLIFENPTSHYKNNG